MLIRQAYVPGVIGRAVEMHARYYSRAAGFGMAFERIVAGGLVDFTGRLGHPGNALWVAEVEGRIVGSIAIDGEDHGGGVAHLRWFILDEAFRGAGIGRRQLAEAVGFSARERFHQILLWTFQGLDAARRLYEAAGFVPAEERPGEQWGSNGGAMGERGGWRSGFRDTSAFHARSGSGCSAAWSSLSAILCVRHNPRQGGVLCPAERSELSGMLASCHRSPRSWWRIS